MTLRSVWMLALLPVLFGGLASGCKSQTAETRVQSVEEASASGGGSARKAKIERARKANRVWQVCVGRAFDPTGEADDALAGAPAAHCKKLLRTEEGRQVLADRLKRFHDERGKVGDVADVRVGRSALELVADAAEKAPGGDSHRLCAEHEKNGACFTRWLLGDVAPGLAAEWSASEIEALAAKPYDDILEAIVQKSLAL